MSTASDLRDSPLPNDPAARREPRLVVLTGGPGAGKTAILEVARRTFRDAVRVLPEAAGIVFQGGFPRRSTDVARKAAQRAILHVQIELEELARVEHADGVILCDRGTIDGAAYWPGDPSGLFVETGTTEAAQLARYATVFHLRTPSARDGYDHSNPLRIESADDASAIDARIAVAWQRHPRRFEISSTRDFAAKVAATMDRIREELTESARTG